jgi:hypothetical protein
MDKVQKPSNSGRIIMTETANLLPILLKMFPFGNIIRLGQDNQRVIFAAAHPQGQKEIAK